MPKKRIPALPRKRKHEKVSNETPSCYVRLKLSRDVDYLSFKKNMTRPCYVRLDRTESEKSVLYRALDMPLLNSKGETLIKGQVATNGIKQESYFAEPPWLDNLDDMSQLLVCNLLTRRTDEFVECLKAFEKKITNQQIHACVEMMLLMPIDAVFAVLNTALETPEIVTVLSSIIINLMIYIFHDDELSMKKNSLLLSLVRAHDLNLWNDSIIYLTSEVDSWKVYLFVVHLFTSERDLATAVDILCQEDRVQKMLSSENTGHREIKLYSTVLVELMRAIYVKHKCELAKRLVMFNLSEPLVPQADVWVPLALGTVIANPTYHVGNTAKIVAEVLNNRIKLPETLLRSSLMRLHHTHSYIAFRIFEFADTYKNLIRSFPNKGPIPRIVLLNFSDTWAIPEFQLAFLWVCNKIKARKPDAVCDFSIRLVPDRSVQDEAIDSKIDFSEHWIPVEQSSAKKRLEKALRGLEPPVIAKFVGSSLEVAGSSLQFYLE